MKFRQPILIFLSGLFLATLAWAGPGGHREGPGASGTMDGPGPDLHGAMIHHLQRAMDQLDLSEAQQDAIHQLLSDGREEMHANRVASMENMRAMHELLQAESLDEDALAQVARQSGELAEQRVLLAGRNVHAILAELDTAQREQLRAMGEEMRQRHRHKRWHEDDES